MSDKLCGLCFRSYSNLKQHLTGSHAIANKDELALLMKYGNARTTKPLDCAICDKRNLVRLDKHLCNVHLMPSQDRGPMVRDAKRRCIVKELAELRETNPRIPMVSSLDAHAFFEEGKGEEIQDDDGQAVPEAKEEIVLNLSLSSDSEAGEATIGVPVLASMPQRPVVLPEVPESSAGAPSAGAPAAGVPSAGAPSADVQTAGVPSAGVSSVDTGIPSPNSTCQATTSGGLTSTSSGATTAASSNGIGSMVSHASSSGGPPQSCHCSCHELVARVKTLEQTVGQLLQLQQGASTPKTPRGVPATLTTSAQKYEHVGKLATSDHLFQRLVDNYQKFRLGAKTSAKEKENARQSASHTLRFCLYMASTLPPKTVSADLKFLMQIDKLRSWPLYLQKKGYAPTTIRNMMNNVVQFIKHVHCSFPSESKLRSSDFPKILYELKQLMANVYKSVVVHRQKVKKKKTDEQLEVTNKVKFLQAAKAKIPELFGVLPDDGSHGKEHCQLMGYVMGYLSILTGHRSIVLRNMTREQVLTADSWSSGTKFRILVDEHKTAGSFGQAAVCLNQTEYEWLCKLALGDCCLNKERITHVFHTILGREVKKPSLFLYMAWSNCGLTGAITFGQIRSRVSTQAKHHLTEEEHSQVARAMCHDPATADKFYVALPDKDTGYATRRLRLKALKKALDKSRKPTDTPEDSSSLCTEDSEDTPESSSEEEEPVLDDKTSSGSSSSSSNDVQMSQKRSKLRTYGRQDVYSSSASEDDYRRTPRPRPKKSSKKRLDFSRHGQKSPTEMKLPLTCRVTLPRMPPATEDYFIRKSRSMYAMPERRATSQASQDIVKTN